MCRSRANGGRRCQAQHAGLPGALSSPVQAATTPVDGQQDPTPQQSRGPRLTSKRLAMLRQAAAQPTGAIP